ncbi:MAG: hypothetical protein FWH33_10590 [Oscillospiraceae bacterium]|nr:hypothetical protein [Oscillospiraceae bacterium]
MDNKVFHVSIIDIAKIIKENRNNSGTHIVEINGSLIQTWENYIDEIENLFCFPTRRNTIDGYLDWIRDLSWLHKDRFLLILYNYRHFLQDQPALKEIIMNDFWECILPWWQKDVESFVVDGKAKEFCVYLVE